MHLFIYVPMLYVRLVYMYVYAIYNSATLKIFSVYM